MSKRKSLLISVVAVIISGLLVFGLYQLQHSQLMEQETVDVVVPKYFLAAGTMISEENIVVKSLPRSVVTEEMVVSRSEIIGMEAIAPLGENEPILHWRLNYHHLQPRYEEATFQIPKEYVLSISNGIRAGDKVVVYLSSADKPSERLFPQSIVVASVKSSSNTEVDNLQQSHLLSLAEGNQEQMYVARRDANAMIEYLNLNLTEQQWLEIDELCKAGTAKLVVAYSPESYEQQQVVGAK
ncbi:SAF domain-containing protein [Paenibacillus yanchengensis]|uniref:SAF domain-containing protein n=1 Tax=Paenibacillus yanchengensis TaxID=2035833 RepID=A0ABW4YIY5_9BACL